VDQPDLAGHRDRLDVVGRPAQVEGAAVVPAGHIVAIIEVALGHDPAKQVIHDDQTANVVEAVAVLIVADVVRIIAVGLVIVVPIVVAVGVGVHRPAVVGLPHPGLDVVVVVSVVRRGLVEGTVQRIGPLAPVIAIII